MDAESAEIALRAAMTGHIVLSTLHTNDAVTSALRFNRHGCGPIFGGGLAQGYCGSALSSTYLRKLRNGRDAGLARAAD